MTKKDYIKLAKLIKEGNLGGAYLNKATIVNGLCDILQDDNPRFDRERFITACQ